MKNAVIFFLLMAEALPAAAGYNGENMIDPKQAMVSLLPLEAGGWKAAPAEDQFFDTETIFGYIDGAGEVYRAYNFRLLFSRRYHREGQADLVADLFDMGSSLDAFGVFTHDLEGEDVGLGQGSTYKGGLLSFWRDRYFVSLTAEAETEETKAALVSLGREVASSIGRDGRKPDLLNFLPEDFRNPRATHYFHAFPILNYHFFVSPENILNLGPETEAVLAARSAPSGTGGAEKAAVASSQELLMLVRYPQEKFAVKAMESFCDALMPKGAAGRDKAPTEQQGIAEENRFIKTEEGQWTAIGTQKSLVMIVFQAPTAEEAGRILDRLVTNSEKL